MSGWSVKEMARDVLGLASVPFYGIVTVRAVIGGYPSFLIRLLVGAGGLMVIYLLGRHLRGRWGRGLSEANGYAARGIVICLCAMLYYQSAFFNVFALVLLAGLYASARYLGASGGSLAGGSGVGVMALALALALTSAVMAVLGIEGP